MRRAWPWLASALLLVLLTFVGLSAGKPDARTTSDTKADTGATAVTADIAQQLRRGDYLTRAGNCAHCHTASGGVAFAGGRAIDTPFGMVYSSNLTPDAQTGLGNWTADDFWRAMHHGQAKDGRWLLPVFPYTNYTRVSRADSDAIFAWLQSQTAVSRANTQHALRWPYNTQWALGLWRALYFRSQSFVPDAAQSAAWNRGAYLVQGLGHCSACHAPRNALGAGADSLALSGGMVAQQGWYAPSLLNRSEAGVQDWDNAQIVRLLQAGSSDHATVSGPMAQVVLHSTQYLERHDIEAMALYLKTLPEDRPTRVGLSSRPADTDTLQQGARVYERECVSCHGRRGEGVPGAYPALAGNRAVTLASHLNLVQIVLNGGFAPATALNPRPYGMPPFALALTDREVAAVLSYVRSAWGNQADAVDAAEVDRLRKHTLR